MTFAGSIFRREVVVDDRRGVGTTYRRDPGADRDPPAY
jgi:hypothetical protein